MRIIVIFTPVKNRELLSKTVAASIEEAIRSKKIIKGNKLPSEKELCEQFGVSRTALREALRMLSARDLITIVKGKGIYVKGPSADTVTRPLHMFLQMKGEHNYVRDVISARQMLEPAIAAEAAKNRTEEDIERLKNNMLKLEQCEHDHTTLASLDAEFHLDIALASKNTIMPMLLEPIHRLMPEIKLSIYKVVGEKVAKESAILWHGKILSEIIEQNVEGARLAMDEHLKKAADHAEEMLRIQERA